MFQGIVRHFASFVALLALLCQFSPPSLAGTVGSISGTITQSDTHAAVAGARVTASSPSGTARATTDAHGFFSMNGVQPDTYTVSIAHDGYESVSLTGVSVFADQTARADATLQKSLKTIARVEARSAGAAYQPHQTADTYTVTAAQIATIQGAPSNISEKSLLTAMPGVQYSSGIYPTIRGGRTNNVDYEFEGMNYTDSYTQKNINGFKYPAFGLQSVQVSPGSENESFGNSGVGTINVIARRGVYKGGADFAATVGGPGFVHALDFGWGFASPDDRYSSYFSYSAHNSAVRYGGKYADNNASDIGVYNYPWVFQDRELLSNSIIRFGHDNKFNLQFLYDNGFNRTVADYGNLGAYNTCYFTCDVAGQIGAFTIDQPQAFTQGSASTPTGYAGFLDQFGVGHGLTLAQIQSMIQLWPGQKSINEILGGRGLYSENSTHNGTKVQLNYNPNSSTYLFAGWNTTNGFNTSDQPNSALWRMLGGYNVAYTFGLDKTLSDKNTLRFNAEAIRATPHNEGFFTNDELFNMSPTFEGVGELYDWVSPSDPQCPVTYLGTNYCGYLYNKLGISGPTGTLKLIAGTAGARIKANGASFSAGDSWTPNEKLKVDAGVRFEHRHVLYPQYGMLPNCTFYYVPGAFAAPVAGVLADGVTTAVGNPVNGQFIGGVQVVTPVGPGNCPQAYFAPLTKDQTDPTVTEPRIAAALQLSARDAVRVSYGRTARFPHGESADYMPSDTYASNLANVPAFMNPGMFLLTGNYNNNNYYKSSSKTDYYGTRNIAADCGFASYWVPCQTYQQQVFWSIMNGDFPNPLSLLKPVTYSNFDLSYSHQFKGGVGLKLTGWTRRAYDLDIIEQVPATSFFGTTIVNPDGSTSFLNLHHSTNEGIEIADGLEMYLTKERALGLSGQLSATYNNVRQNVAGGQTDEFHGFLQPNTFAQLYRVGYVSPFTSNLALSYRTHSGWRVQARLDYDIGYPYGDGLLTSLLYAGTVYNTPHTNANGGGQTQFIDPANPGSVFKPNIAATLGTPESNQAMGKLSHQNLTADITIEKEIGRGKLGVQLLNVFNEAFTGPVYPAGDFGSQGGGPFTYFTSNLYSLGSGFGLNHAYQPVATGIAGPLTGFNTGCNPSPTNPCLSAGGVANGKSAYLNLPNGIGRQFYIYFTTRL